MPDELTALIAKDLGIDTLALDQQQKLIEQFGEIALKAATLAIVAKLPEDKREEFASLAEGGDAKKLQEFLNQHVSDHEAVAKAAVAAEVERFRTLQTA